MKTKSPVAIVTGGGRRLGKFIALELARRGFHVVIAYDRSASGARRVVSMLKKEGVRAAAVRTDVTKGAQAKRLVSRAKRLFGRIDILVNNAAVFTEAPLAGTTEKTWNTTLNTNLKGTFLCSQAVAPVMLAQKSGRIINIASLGGIQAWPGHIPYCVSKAGVIMLTRCLAKSLAPVVSVNAVAPGTIIMEGEEDPLISHVPVRSIPLGRYGKPSDIASTVGFLATEASYVTGQVFFVDGGRSVQ